MVSGFPDDLWYIIEKSLRVDRDARYETADDFRKELDEFVAEQSEPEMDEQLAALLTRLYPGQEARQAKWERAATSVRVPMHTMRPPVPVPVASTSMLEQADIIEEEPASDSEDSARDSEDSARGAEPPPAAVAVKAEHPGDDAAEEPAADAKKDSAAVPAPIPAATPSVPSRAPPESKKKKSKGAGKKKGKGKGKGKGRKSVPPSRAAIENAPAKVDAQPRRMWVSLLVVGAVLLALALAMSSR